MNLYNFFFVVLLGMVLGSCGGSVSTSPDSDSSSSASLVKLSIEGGSVLSQDIPAEFSVIAYYDDETQKNVTKDSVVDISTSSSPAILFSRTGEDSIKLILDPANSVKGDLAIVASYAGTQQTASVSVTDATLDSISLLPSSNKTLKKDSIYQIIAIAVFSDSSTSNITLSATWTSSDANVAIVEKGVVTIVGNSNTTTIKAILNNKESSLDITAIPKLLDISNSKNFSIVKGLQQVESNFLTALYSDNSTANITLSADYEILNTTIATSTIDSTSVIFYGLNTGSTVIRATFEDKTISIPIAVTQPIISSLKITGFNAKYPVGTNNTPKVIATYTDASTKVLNNSDLSWNTSLDSGEVLASYSGGKYSFLKQGTVVISAEISVNNSIILSNIKTVEITKPAISSIDDMKLHSKDNKVVTNMYSNQKDAYVSITAHLTSGEATTLVISSYDVYSDASNKNAYPNISLEATMIDGKNISIINVADVTQGATYVSLVANITDDWYLDGTLLESHSASSEVSFELLLNKTKPVINSLVAKHKYTSERKVTFDIKFFATNMITGISMSQTQSFHNWEDISELKIIGEFNDAISGIEIGTTSDSDYVEKKIYVYLKDEIGNISEVKEVSILQTTSNTTNDPLFQYQWYISNTGQKAFAYYAALVSNEGSDTNSLPPYSDLHLSQNRNSYGLRGKGVIVNIIDTGLEINHPDLKDNVNTALSENYLDGIGGNIDPTSPATDEGDHGTSVAGIVAMKESNGIGGIGIAPLATLIGHNFLQHQTYANILNSLSVDADIFNMSFGTNCWIVGDIKIFTPSGQDINSCKDSSALDDFYNGAAREIRGGKGGIYIKSSGNGYRSYGAWYGHAYCKQAREHGVSCQNSTHEFNNTFDTVIIVASANAGGVKSSYSTAGPNVWITGFGGEYGSNHQVILDAGVIPGLNNGGTPAMITTDVSGCDVGYSAKYTSSATPINDAIYWLNHVSSEFNYGYVDKNNAGSAHAENPNCDYTNSFNGTSSAAPSISGVVALMLQANPDLNYREVKYILAKTARMPEHTQTATAGFILNLGVIENSAGYKFDNWYGFGIADGDKAVKMARDFDNKDFKNDIKEFRLPATGFKTINKPIPDVDVNGAKEKFTIAEENSSTIELVSVKLSIGHSFPGDLAIYLTSPSGTVSQLLNHFSGVNNIHENNTEVEEVITRKLFYNTAVFSSNAFYGEESKGEWEIKVVDIQDENFKNAPVTSNATSLTDNTGYFFDYSVKILGH